MDHWMSTRRRKSVITNFSASKNENKWFTGFAPGSGTTLDVVKVNTPVLHLNEQDKEGSQNCRVSASDHYAHLCRLKNRDCVTAGHYVIGGGLPSPISSASPIVDGIKNGTRFPKKEMGESHSHSSSIDSAYCAGEGRSRSARTRAQEVHLRVGRKRGRGAGWVPVAGVELCLPVDVERVRGRQRRRRGAGGLRRHARQYEYTRRNGVQKELATAVVGWWINEEIETTHIVARADGAHTIETPLSLDAQKPIKCARLGFGLNQVEITLQRSGISSFRSVAACKDKPWDRVSSHPSFEESIQFDIVFFAVS
ncbi:hypothetical protein B0H14DRAFT_3163316 [Mycena olivaceomarginata]|nr:hypothetical protein B0H14DRAFT_3163316 [Mycena olivaceomarginata]